MLTITRRIRWCMAHRLANHDGLCANIHGHNFTAELEFAHLSTIYVRCGLEGTVDQHDELGVTNMVADLGELGALFQSWADDTLDHALMLAAHDPMVETLRHSVRVVIASGEPTIEYLALELLETVGPMLLADQPWPIGLYGVTVRETENHVATARLEPPLYSPEIVRDMYESK